MPVLLGDRGEVQGVKDALKMISAAPDTKGSSRYCRPKTRARCSSFIEHGDQGDGQAMREASAPRGADRLL